jgi:non-canonical poly(A) RNA polymerase PAPD5/7
MAPTPAEAAARTAAVDRLRSVVATIWPAASVAVFGSTAAGLALPTSDVDCAVLGAASPDPPSALRALAAGLLRDGVAVDIQVIARARVPIAKYTDAASGLAIDAALDGGSGGPPAAAAAAAWLRALPALRPLLTVLKTVLHQRELAEVYTGGLGSYALLVMVAAFLVDKQATTGRGGGAGGGEACLGTLLLECVDLYGRRLNTHAVGVTLRAGSPVFFPKHRVPWSQPGREGGLAVGDPAEPRNDLAGGTWAWRRVRDAFAHIGTALAAPAGPGEGPGASLLARIIRPDAVVAGRARPADLVAAARAGVAASAALAAREPPPDRRDGHHRRHRDRSYSPQARPPPPKRWRREEEDERRGGSGGGGCGREWGAGGGGRELRPGSSPRRHPRASQPSPPPPPRSAKRAKGPSHKRFE